MGSSIGFVEMSFRVMNIKGWNIHTMVFSVLEMFLSEQTVFRLNEMLCSAAFCLGLQLMQQKTLYIRTY